MKKSDVVLMLGAAVLLSAGAVQAKGLDVPVTLNGISAQRMSDKELAAVEAKGNFPKGQCTWYVDQQVRNKWGSNFNNGVPWQGNAKD